MVNRRLNSLKIFISVILIKNLVSRLVLVKCCCLLNGSNLPRLELSQLILELVLQSHANRCRMAFLIVLFQLELILEKNSLLLAIVAVILLLVAIFMIAAAFTAATWIDLSELALGDQFLPLVLG